MAVVQGQEKKVPGAGFAAVAGQKGGQDVFGPYDPVQNWEKPLTDSLPELKGWTFSQATYVFPETPDRVFVAQKVCCRCFRNADLFHRSGHVLFELDLRCQDGVPGAGRRF